MVSLAALALLAACATTTPAATPSAPPPSSSSAGASRTAQLLSAAGRADSPTIAEIERVLGRADLRRQDGAGAALTYRLQTCALFLVFTADARNAMRLAQAHASARRAGEAAPSLDQCAAEAAASR